MTSAFDQADTLGDDISDFNEDSILPQSLETARKIRTWVSPINYDDEAGEHKKYLSLRLTCTKNSLLHSSADKEWHARKDYGMLWIEGCSTKLVINSYQADSPVSQSIPGSGKSVFAATLAHEGVPVLYFYFRRIVDAKCSPVLHSRTTSMIRTIMEQRRSI
jgi:hypothetical protein